MKRRFTFLLTFMVLVIINVSAQFSTDGLYTIQCNGTSKYMTNPGTEGANLPMSVDLGEDTEFYIIENTATPGKYNIITKDEMYLVASDYAKGVLIDNTEANRNSNTSGALVDMLDLGANPYRFESSPNVTNPLITDDRADGSVRGWNGQRGGDTGLGMGTSVTAKYEWNLTRVGDLPEVILPKSIYINFEDDSKVSNWVLESATDNVNISIAAPSTSARSGSNVIVFDGFNRSTGYHVRNTTDSVAVNPGDYIHSITYAGSSEAGPRAVGTYWSTMDAPTPGNWTTLNSADVSDLLTLSRQNTTTDIIGFFPRFRMHPTNTQATAKIYFDDFVLYTDSNSKIDLVAPEAATDIEFLVQTATSNEISWTEGVDTLTGVRMTYILRTMNASAEAPVLMPQVGYSVEGGIAGSNTVGDWTVIATVNAGTTSYTDNDVTEGQDYKYAVVHKDLAYNNSVATVLQEEVPTGVNNTSVEMFSYFSVKNGVELSNLTVGVNVEVYNISGMKVFSQTVLTSRLRIDLPKGIYIVRAKDAIAKVAVQ